MFDQNQTDLMCSPRRLQIARYNIYVLSYEFQLFVCAPFCSRLYSRGSPGFGFQGERSATSRPRWRLVCRAWRLSTRNRWRSTWWVGPLCPQKVCPLLWSKVNYYFSTSNFEQIVMIPRGWILLIAVIPLLLSPSISIKPKCFTHPMKNINIYETDWHKI